MLRLAMGKPNWSFMFDNDGIMPSQLIMSYVLSFLSTRVLQIKVGILGETSMLD